MKIALFGQKWLAVGVLRELLRLPGVEIVVVCPDTERDRLAAEARQRGIPIAGVSGVPACDMAVAAYCQIYIPASVRARCGLGVLAYHPSLLPRHRGRDAVRWTIAMREPVTGGSVYWMNDGVDTGSIEAQDWCHVLPGEDAAALWRRALAPMGVHLLVQVVSRLAGGAKPQAVPQDERVATWELAFIRQRLAPH